jgi:galactokinase
VIVLPTSAMFVARVPHMSAEDVNLVARAFAERHGHDPTGVWDAPGRVNVIGEHTDYNDGFVLPFALAQRVTMAAGLRSDDRWSVMSLTNGESTMFARDDLVPGMPGWQAYVAGVVWALAEAGHQIGGADLLLTSDVPVGAGLSSSAALECATISALADLNDLDIDLLQRAKLARRAENEFVGAPTGLMDQAASTLCTPGHALFFDCRSLDSQQVRMELSPAGLELMVLDTRTPHALVDSEYATRRASCAEASHLLGVAALRDVTDLDSAMRELPDPVMRQRLRHVVTENARVQDSAEALRGGRFGDLAALLNASHASMRDDFEITVPTVDLAVETAIRAGALGARMTGGGFGGCILALIPTGESGRIVKEVETAFARAGYRAPSAFVAVPSGGAHRAR